MHVDHGNEAVTVDEPWPIGGARPKVGRNGGDAMSVETTARYEALQEMICGGGTGSRDGDKQGGWGGRPRGGGRIREGGTKKKLDTQNEIW